LSLVPQDITDVLSADGFKAAFRNHPSGVAIVTADDGTGPVAMTVSSVFSISAVPPLLVFSASDLSSSTPTIRNAETVVVHLLGADQLSLAQLGATSGVDRFGPDVKWDRLTTGEPYYPDVHAWIRGRIVNRLDAGTATVFVVEALQSQAPEPGSAAADAGTARPLVYHNRTWHVLGDHSRA
jgi:flavin reductase (DIM6/NTAB) family NADH-FMN oxidoreductase RutF